MLPKLQRYLEACIICQRSKPKRTAQQPYYGRILVDYIPCENLAVDLKSMPKGFLNYEHLLIATCEKTNFVYAIPLQNKKTQTIAKALIHRVFLLTGPPTKLSIDQDSALTSQVITEVLKSLECTMQIISPHLHYMVKIFTTKFTPHVVKIQIFTPHVVKNCHFFRHIIYTTCGENYTVKSKIGLTSLMSGVQLKIFQVVVKIIISCHLVLKIFI